MTEIIVVGDIDTDIFYLVPHIPTWDEGVIVNSTHILPGGKGANTACVLSKLNVETGLVATVGNDYFGKIGVGGLDAHKVEKDGIIVKKNSDTYHCIMMLDDSGEKAILVNRTDITYPSPEDLNMKIDYLLTAKHVHYIALEPSRMIDSIKILKSHNIKISIDIDAAYAGLPAYEEILSLSDIVIMNKQGAQNLFPDCNCEDTIRKILNYGANTVVMTRGSKGSIGANRLGEMVEQPPVPTKVVDSTGSGDTFSAAFIYSVYENMDLKKSLEFASQIASLSLQHIGGQEFLFHNDLIKGQF